MAIPSSGPISLATIAGEFGGGNPISLSSYYKGGAYVKTTDTAPNVPTSGAISVSNFYGAAKYIPTAKFVQFTSNGSYTIPSTVVGSIKYIVIGGGGGGGPSWDEGGGGGGAGGVVIGCATTLPGEVVSFTIGGGGGAGGGNGGTTTISSTSIGSKSAYGGGGGDPSANCYNYGGHAGGSGGGGDRGTLGGSYTQSYPNYGNKGGYGVWSDNAGGGGGGGAGRPGGLYTTKCINQEGSYNYQYCRSAGNYTYASTAGVFWHGVQVAPYMCQYYAMSVQGTDGKYYIAGNLESVCCGACCSTYYNQVAQSTLNPGAFSRTRGGGGIYNPISGSTIGNYNGTGYVIAQGGKGAFIGCCVIQGNTGSGFGGQGAAGYPNKTPGAYPGASGSVIISGTW